MLQLSETVRSGFVNYTRAAMAILAAAYPDPYVLPLELRRDWGRNERGELVEATTAQPNWGFAVFSDRLLRALPERQELLKALAEDPAIGPRLEAFVSTPLGGRLLRGSDVVDQAVIALAGRLGQFGFDSAVFHEVLAVAEHMLLAPTEPLALIAPLPRVELREEIALADGLTLRRLHPEEVARCLWLGVLEPPSPAFRHLFGLPDGTVGIATTYELPVTVGVNGTEEQHRAAMQVTDGLRQLVHDALRALRLAAPGRLETPGVVSYELWHWPGAQGGQVSSSATHAHLNTWTAPPGLAERAPMLLARLRSDPVRNDRRLQATLRRFDFASTRLRDDDRLVDLFIAAETLFEVDDHSGKGARIAERASQRLAGTALAVDAAFLAEDYTQRNRIVHDGIALEDASAPILQSVGRVERVMRASLQLVLAAETWAE